MDLDGVVCVRVVKGKGGKKQLQAILPADEQFVASYFDGTENPVFVNDILNNHLNLHAIRAAHARDCYAYYAAMDPAQRAELWERLQTRYMAAGHTESEAARWRREVMGTGGGVYHLRGASLDHARPVTYDRLALMAVSVYHLSHWRLDVTVSNYMLAV